MQRLAQCIPANRRYLRKTHPTRDHHWTSDRLQQTLPSVVWRICTGTRGTKQLNDSAYHWRNFTAAHSQHPGRAFFYSLNTGRVLNRNHWTELPTPADAITRVNTLVKQSADTLTFTYRHGISYDDDDYHPAYGNEEPDGDDLGGSISGVDEDEVNNLQNDTPPTLVPVDDEGKNDDYGDRDSKNGDKAIKEETADIDTALGEKNTVSDANNTITDSIMENNPLLQRALKKLSTTGKTPEILPGRTRQ